MFGLLNVSKLCDFCWHKNKMAPSAFLVLIKIFFENTYIVKCANVLNFYVSIRTYIFAEWNDYRKQNKNCPLDKRNMPSKKKKKRIYFMLKILVIVFFFFGVLANKKASLKGLISLVIFFNEKLLQIYLFLVEKGCKQLLKMWTRFHMSHTNTHCAKET
ncbi:hypothetical protein RFI_03612 [Reticulomyxa filosa]|uniref:Uncharacterized protein n=1 Tax=Reticulomyxa filosa TaxID=46433 RepID=X6P5U0_RETFI|nr:hypothetical protein RFI_03612 [Reticulomyxa filosa]|eukprot:ETO33488.1 hypothetical protein RFI_03612 [Reticulomyxa filosa]